MKLKNVALLSTIGTALEWYDFALFGSLAPIIAKLFFPEGNAFISLMLTFTIFAVGFIIRPLSAGILGHFGDRYGRLKVLSFSIILMTIPTVMIGLLPTYVRIGVFAPILLLLFRILQGFSVGGEYSGAITYLSEISKSHHRSCISSLSVFGVVGGLFLGSMVSAVTSHLFSSETLLTFGWRIPFLLSIFLGFAGYYLRAKAFESPEFNVIKNRNEILKAPLHELWKNKKRAIAVVISLFWPVIITTYLVLVYEPTKLAQYQSISMSQALTFNAINTLIFTLLIPFFGWLADKTNPQKIIGAGLISFITLSIPTYYLFSSHNVFFIFTAQTVFAAIMALTVAPIPSYIASLFPVNVRLTGISIGLNISAAVFGGTAPLVGIVLEKLTHCAIASAVYIVLSAIIALVGLRYSKTRL